VDFNAWYRAQTKYRTADDRTRDAVLEEESMTMPEMARLLLITRKEVYRILYGKNANRFEFITIANRRRVTKKSFERWYAGQSKYRKLCDRTPEEVEKMEREKQEAEHPEIKIDVNKAAFTLQEAAVLLDITYQEVRALIGEGTLEAKKYGVKYLIPREDIKWFIFRRTMDCEK
jgi:DNA binding domain, excisionase family